MHGADEVLRVGEEAVEELALVATGRVETPRRGF